MSTSTSVLDRQTAALKRMLAVPSESDDLVRAEPSWKILILDKCTQDIIAPLLDVRELRELGVTLHLDIDSPRDAIPDVPVVYFVQPSKANVERICEDFRNQLYDLYYFNFVSPIPREQLESLAKASVENSVTQQIKKIYDQYLNFISLGKDLFIYRNAADDVSFFEFNRGDVKDAEMNAMIDAVVECLFSVFITLGTVPIIRCPRHNAAEVVAERLEQRIKETLRDPKANLFCSDSGSAHLAMLNFQRPLLVILDRNMDLATPLHHTWSYQALMHDVMDYYLNKVVITTTSEDAPASSDASSAAPPPKRKKKRFYDLSANDAFWVQQCCSPFPNVAEAVQEELENYKNSESEVKRLKAQMGLGDGDTDEAVSLISDHTARLTSAVSSLPELLEKKKIIDTHTRLATEILDIIKARHLDNFFETEEKIMAKGNFDDAFLDLLANHGSPDDKMRLFLINYICGPTMPEYDTERFSSMEQNHVKQHIAMLKDAGCDLSPISFVKQWKALTTLHVPASQYAGGGTRTVQMFSKLMSQGSQFVMEGVKNLVVKRHNLPITRIVDALMERKSMPETDDYRYFDPKLLRGGASAAQQQQQAAAAAGAKAYQEAIVFVVGGGCFLEYHNLIDYCKSKASSSNSARRVIYGCTELLNAMRFLSYLSALGSEQSAQ